MDKKLFSFCPRINEKTYQCSPIDFFSKIILDNKLDYPFRWAIALGINRFVFPKTYWKDSILVKKCLDTLIFIDKETLLIMEIDGIRVGDLFYDWNLRKEN